MIVIERSKNRGEPGWWPVDLGNDRSALIVCPNCNRRMALTNHTIAQDGSVGPSVVCPYVECPRCGWHEYVKLAGWKESELKTR